MIDLSSNGRQELPENFNYRLSNARANDINIQKFIKRLPNRELGIERQSFIHATGGADHNPSPIAQTTFVEMMKDPQIYAGRRIIDYAVLSKGYNFRYAGEDEEFGKDMIEFLKRAFTVVNRDTFQNGGMWFSMMDMLQNGGDFGYSVGEMVFAEPGEMFDDDYIYMKKLKVLPNDTLEDCFRISDYGELEEVIQNRGRQNEVTFDEPIDLYRLVIYSHNKKSGNWYGQSDLVPVWENYFAKYYIRHFYWIYLERFASPFLVGTVQNPNHMSDMNDALDSARTRTCFTVLDGDKVEKVETSHQGEAYEQSIKYLNTEIMTGLLIPTLLMGIESTGARSLGDVHFTVFLWHVKSRQEEYKDVWQNLINKLIDLNFPPEKVNGVYPEMVFPVVATKDMGQMTDAIWKLVTGGIINPNEDWIRKVLEIPDDDFLNKTGGFFNTQPTTEPDNAASDDTVSEKPETLNVTSNTKSSKSKRQDPVFKENFVHLRIIADRYEERFKEIIGGYLEEQKEYIKKNNLPEVRQEPSVEPYKRNMRITMTGLSEEIIDYNKAGFDDIGLELNYTFSKQALNEIMEDLTNTTFKGTVDKVGFAAKEKIIQGIGDGLGPKDLAKLVDKVYDGYSANQLNSVTRTLVTDIQNASRLELYKANKNFVTGVVFDAVLDERTTVFCETHHGMRISLDNPDIEALRPPCHFSCRSIFSPTTILDGPFDESYSINNSVDRAKELGVPEDQMSGALFPQEEFGKDFFQNKYGGVL